MTRSLFGPALYILLTVSAAPVLASPEPETAERPAPVAVQRVQGPAAIPEEAAILLVGTALLGIAAAVRRAV